MSSGKQHDRACKNLAVLGAGIIAFFTGNLNYAALFATGSMLGLVLSPDLDLPRSNARRRWNNVRLGWLWWLYESIIPHRSWLSHSPIIGTAGRLGYLASALVCNTYVTAFVCARLFGVGIVPEAVIARVIMEGAKLTTEQYAVVFAGLALADALHLWMDLSSTADKRAARQEFTRQTK